MSKMKNKQEILKTLDVVECNINLITEGEKILSSNIKASEKYSNLKKQGDIDFIYEYGEELMNESIELNNDRNKQKKDLINDIVELDKCQKDNNLEFKSTEELLYIKEELSFKNRSRFKKIINFFKGE